MPIPLKAKEISERLNEPFEVWFPRILAQHKTEVKVAAALGVYPNTVRNWKAKYERIERQRTAAK